MATVDRAIDRADARNEPEANKLFRMVMKHKGSDLHLKVGLPPAHAARPACSGRCSCRR